MIDPVLSPSAVETLSGPLPMRPGSRPAFDPSVTPRFDPLESQQFEEALRAAVDSRPPLGPAMLDAVAGGNRLRPLMVREAFLAAAFAALVRGTAAATTVGPSVDLLARSVAVMCRGQQQDLVADDPDARRRANARKSGVLFATSGVLGVLAAGRRLDAPMVRRMIGLGMRLGTTYQAVDDVRDGDGDGRAAAVQFAALERRLATLPDLPRVRVLIDRFHSAAAAARAIRPVA